LPDGKSLVGLADQSGEVEWWKLAANGVGDPSQLSRDGKTLRYDGVPSPDGRWIAHTNKDQELWLLDLASGNDKRVARSEEWDDIRDLAWSPDSRWLAYVAPAANLLTQVWLYDRQTGTQTAVTGERWDSYGPAWSPDGKWLWFLSDRHFDSVVRSIWGSRQPDPFFDKPTQIYGLALRSKYRSPWAKADELEDGSGSDGGDSRA